jgi:hypothetical protein
MHHTAGDVDTTLHATRKTTHQLMPSVAQANPLQSPLQTMPQLAPLKTMQPSECLQILQQCQITVDRQLLGYHPQLLRGAVGPQRFSEEANRPTIQSASTR